MLDERTLIGKKYVSCILFLWAGASVLLNSTIKEFLWWKRDSFNMFVDYGTLILLMINIFVFQKYTKKEILIIVIGTIFISIATMNSSNNTLMGTWIFIVASKNIDFDEVIRVVYKSQLLAFWVVIFLFLSGNIRESILYRGHSIRHSLGFSHPNQLGTTIFLLAVCRIYCKKDKISFFDAMITVGAAIFVKKVSNSQTSFYSLAILAIVVIIHMLLGRYKDIMDKISSFYIAMAIAANMISVCLSIANSNRIPILRMFDSFLSQRFSMCYRAFEKYGISLFGQDVKLFINSFFTGKVYIYYMDNAYMALLLRYGLLVYVLFSVVYISTISMLRKKANYIAVGIMCLYAIYGIMENNLLSISQNVFLFLLGNRIFQLNGSLFVKDKNDNSNLETVDSRKLVSG